MTSIQSKYAKDYREHEVTRLENDRSLLPKLDAIRHGEDIESLERFAKAYLGMYLDIDNNIPPQQRIVILANPQLAEAVLQGFETVLQQQQFPGETEIADAMLDEKPIAIGYILLAALDMFNDDARFAVSELAAATIRSAVCLHYAAKTEASDSWFQQILASRQQDVASALTIFWQRLIERDCDHLPGLYQIIQHTEFDAISRQVILPVLAQIQQCRKAILRDLLQAALRICDYPALQAICDTAVQQWNRADPGRYMLWLSSAYLLQPEHYAMPLAEYCGFSKEKILPLLDFSVQVLQNDSAQRLRLSATAITTLLRIIAAKMTPQYDRYGNLCDNTQKIMYLFYRLAIAEAPTSAIRELGQVRVMKLYSAILKQVSQIHMQAVKPDFDAFLTRLHDTESVKSRKKWSDLGHS